MASHDPEELIDYEDEGDLITNGSIAVQNGSAIAITGADGDEKEKKSYVGIHSTGFRYELHVVVLPQSKLIVCIFLKGFFAEARTTTSDQ